MVSEPELRDITFMTACNIYHVTWGVWVGCVLPSTRYLALRRPKKKKTAWCFFYPIPFPLNKVTFQGLITSPHQTSITFSFLFLSRVATARRPSASPCKTLFLVRALSHRRRALVSGTPSFISVRFV